MKFIYPTQTATILKRYKRFLSDIKLDSGEEVVAHVPNTGSMTTCWGENWKVLISENDNPKRKLKYTLELTHNGESWICVNTGMTNKLVLEALKNDVITEFLGYQEIKPEKKVKDSRIDFFLSGHPIQPDTFIEVKNVTLKGEGNDVLFPDSVSIRGQKHLRDLIDLKQEGFRTCMLYVVNREDGTLFKPAKEIDPKYAELLKEAKAAGVEILAYKAALSETEVVITHKIETEI
jgi:sugar fermentation stimulation protein A